MITAVTTCMGRRNHLEMSLPLMLEVFERVIVVDWSCPENSGRWAESEGAEVVYKKDQEFFNISKARNFGARAVKSRTVCFVDADTLVMPSVLNELESLLSLNTMILSARTAQSLDVPSLGGFLALDIGQFWGVGGYDETLEGYALEDNHIRARLCLDRGMSAKRLSGGALGSIRHTNELRGRYFREPIEVSSHRSYVQLQSYLMSRGVNNWVSDPRTAEVAFRTPGLL